MTEHRGYADVCADRKERHRPRGCPGGQHYMRRDPHGPADRPWRCVRDGCDHEQAWSGGIAAWMANHRPVRPAGDDQVPGQTELPLGMLGLLQVVGR